MNSKQTHEAQRNRRGAWSLVAACAVVLGVVSTGVEAVCRAGSGSVLPVPAVTWLRSWQAEFGAPARLEADGEGRVYVSDPGRGKIVLRATNGALLLSKTGLGKPTGIALVGGEGILVGDGATGSVTLFDPEWSPRLSLGAGDGEFGLPGDIAVDPASREIYVADTARDRVEVYSASGVRLRSLGGPAPADGLPAAEGLFRTPTGVVVAGDEILVADQQNFRVQAFDRSTGAFLYCIGTYRATSFFSPSSGPARLFGMIQGLWVDAIGRLYVVDTYQGQVSVIDRSNGALIATIGQLGEEGGALRRPTDLAIDRFGRLFVASAGNAQIEMYGIDSYSDPESRVPATARVSPERINRLSPPVRIEAQIEVPGYRAIDITTSSVRVNGVPASSLGVEDLDGNGAPELRVSVDAASFLKTVRTVPDAVVRITGLIGSLGFDATTTVEVSGTVLADADRDGVPDAADLCPSTPVGQAVDAAGCSVRQACPCKGTTPGGHWRNHGDYQQCVVSAARNLRSAGKISKKEFTALVRSAAHSNCGRKK